MIANEYGVFKNAVREWFAEIQRSVGAGRLRLIRISPGTSLFRAIVLSRSITTCHLSGSSGWPGEALSSRWAMGYGFAIEGLPGDLGTKVLKLHGSTSWLAPLFGGMTSGFSAFQPSGTLSERPVIARNELSFLGYTKAVDPRFEMGGRHCR